VVGVVVEEALLPLHVNHNLLCWLTLHILLLITNQK
jgi:hypothetical protein